MEAYLLIIQLMLLLMSLYLAVGAMSVWDLGCSDPHCILLIALMAPPPLLLALLLPALLRDFVLVSCLPAAPRHCNTQWRDDSPHLALTAQVSNVELMKKQAVVKEVVRMQNTQRAMRALRMLGAMALNAQVAVEEAGGKAAPPSTPIRVDSTSRVSPSERLSQPRARQSGSPTAWFSTLKSKMMTPRHQQPRRAEGAAKRVYGPPDEPRAKRRRAEIESVFKVFDRENTGELVPENVATVLGMHATQHGVCDSCCRADVVPALPHSNAKHQDAGEGSD